MTESETALLPGYTQKSEINVVDICVDAVRENLANLLINYEPLPGETNADILQTKVAELGHCYRLKSYPDQNPIGIAHQMGN